MVDGHGLVILCIGCSLMAVHFAIFVRNAMHVDWRELLSGPACSRITSFVSSWLSDHAKDDPHTAEVERLVAARRLKMAGYLYNVASCCWICVEMSTLVNIATGTTSFLTNSLEILSHCVFFVFTAIKVQPRLLNHDTIDVWYSVFMIMSIVSASPLFVYKSTLPTLSKSIAAIQVLGGFTSLNIPLVFFWSCVFLIVAGISYHFGDSDCKDLPYTSTFVLGELISLLNTVFMLNGMKNAMRMQARQEIETKSARSETSAVTALLSTMGDAVVELDRDLRIKRHCPQLATMLFQGQGRRLEGMPFEQLLASEDDTRLFRAYMAQDVAFDKSLANVFHVNVRDTLNNHVRIEIFHVCKAETSDDQDDHLLGIREDTEFENQDAIQAMGPFSAAGATSRATDDPQATLTLDATSLEVREYSQAFLSLCGQRPMNGAFSEWIASQNRKAFMKHFTSKIDKWKAAPSTVGPVLYKNMNLKVPLGAHSSFRFQADCTISLSWQESDADRAGERTAIARAAFRDIEKQGPKTSRHQRRGEDGSGSSDSESSRRSRSSRQQAGRLAEPPAVEPRCIGIAADSEVADGASASVQSL